MGIFSTMFVYLGDAISRMIPWIVLILPIYLIIRTIILLRRKKRRFNIRFSLKREFALAGFCIYLIFVFSVTVFPDISPSFNFYYPGGGFGPHNIQNEYINLIPGNIFLHFKSSFKYYGGAALWISLLGNILLFVPLGFLFSYLFTNRFRINLLVGAGISLAIELFQLFLPRSTDIDDLLSNVLGMLIGCLIFYLTKKIASQNSVCNKYNL